MGESSDDILRLSFTDGVLRLTLNRPASRNALSRGLIAALAARFLDAERNPNVRAIVLASEGSVFSAGHDLSEMQGRSEEEYRATFEGCSRMMQAIRRLPVPVVARMQGPALAAGCQLVAACDLAVAAEPATFSTPGVKIGLFCTTPMVPLVRAVPPKAAMEMLLTGEPISSARARELGLVNRVVPADRLDEEVDRLLAPILAASREVVRLGKEAFYEGLALPEPAAYERANATMVANAVLPDAAEGIAAFLQKRKPAWPSS